MILFRKEYIKANDNIKVDQKLLEKTLKTAFGEKRKKRVYSYRPITSVAAAIVLVIGCSVAYPNLVNKPVIENPKPVVTIAPIGDEFLPVAEETQAPKTTKLPKKKVSLPAKKVEESIPSQSTTYIEVIPPVVENQPSMVDVPVVAAETVLPVEAAPEAVSEIESPIEDVPSVARVIANQESIEDQLNITDEYMLMESDEENYVFENSDGKKFSVTVEETEAPLETALWEEDETSINLTFNNDDKIYTVKSENISKAELTEIFNEYIN